MIVKKTVKAKITQPNPDITCIRNNRTLEGDKTVKMKPANKHKATKHL